ncbi:dTDP-glucose 4,6-dehydratase [Sanyastnella coralliicola]|uniref:dTDP-glucose 4,6-dehydratase n=1 Tax=Sanyastnella coralliicola TaxID=3069118 RepID=UPI0027BAAB78|nr:dTDP-glucose 4,6-dehydratase [Longitalea sp. SCSIO 12813]
MTFERTILITGGAGFIGSHLLRLMVNKYPQTRFVNFDALTYAGNLANLHDIESKENYIFFKGDITSPSDVNEAFDKYVPDGIIHLAAESHVDRSIEDPLAFIRTNVLGTGVLMNACRQHWKDNFEGKRFHHVSTDEVFGSLGAEGFFTETTAYDPRSPYSASKASSDHLVSAYHHTYGLPVVISNCSNNYGSHQFPEKLIPLMIRNIIQEKPLPVYGEGINVRDWLFVEDHASAIDVIFHKGIEGETYCIGGENEWRNIDLVKLLCKVMDTLLGRPDASAEQLITFVKDRAGHDLRYAIDATKLATELGWRPSLTFEEGLRKTAEWYLNNQAWLEEVTSGSYQEYYERHYLNR